MNFTLEPNSRKTFDFKTDKSQDLALKIRVDVQGLFDVGGQLVNDVLRVIVSAISDDEIIQQNSNDLQVVLSDGQLTLTPIALNSRESGTTVIISGQTIPVRAKSGSIVLINNTDTETLTGRLDLTPGDPKECDNESTTFVMIEDAGLPGTIGAGVDVPQDVVRFEIYSNNGAGDLVDLRLPLVAQQIGPGGAILRQNVGTLEGSQFVLHPNCLAIMIKPQLGDSVTAAGDAGFIRWYTFK